MGYWDERRHPLLLRARADVPALRSLVLLVPRADVSRTAASSWPAPRPGIVSTTSPSARPAPPPPNGTIFDRLERARHLVAQLLHRPAPGAAVPARRTTRHTSTSSSPIDQFFTDAAAGTLPAVSFVDPRLRQRRVGGEPARHPQAARPFASRVINAVMAGPGWPKTLLIWIYDEHGGYYDHVPPPRADHARRHPARHHRAARPARRLRPLRLPRPGRHRLAVRAPATTCRTCVHDHTSILKLIETKWNLPALTYRDANADNLLDCLDFRRPPAFLEPPTLPAPGPSTLGVHRRAARVRSRRPTRSFPLAEPPRQDCPGVTDRGPACRHGRSLEHAPPGTGLTLPGAPPRSAAASASCAGLRRTRRSCRPPR